MKFCENCMKNNEKPPRLSPDPAQRKPPPGVCPVCFLRYGKFIPICRKGLKP